MDQTYPSDDPPEISVAVSTYQRARQVVRLVEALERQTLAPSRFEVVIADNGSTDDTATVLADIAARTSLRLRVARCETNRGPSVGRNLAWRATRGPVVAFTDDDCVPAPEWLERGLANLRPGEILAGRTGPNPEQRHLLGAFSRTMWPSNARFMPTCNMFYWREDLVAVDGFDEEFATPGGEDTDLGLRVRKLGRRVRLEDAPIVHHDVRPSSFRVTLRETRRWVDLPRMIAKHPEVRSEFLYARYFWKQSHPRAILALGGIVAAPLLFPALLLTIPWLRFWLRSKRTGSRRERIRAAPGRFLVDLLEVLVMLRGSIRHRALVL